jgi:3-oxoacyl-[acyl-carrier-protein] synthase III
MVSASIPVALDIAQQEGKLKPGAKVLLLGLAAGVSIAPMALRW